LATGWFVFTYFNQGWSGAFNAEEEHVSWERSSSGVGIFLKHKMIQ
jgi:hypothetical protein